MINRPDENPPIETRADRESAIMCKTSERVFHVMSIFLSLQGNE